MKQRASLFAAGILFATVILTGCAPSQQFQILTPDGAYNITHRAPDKRQYGIQFDIKTPKSSYDGFNYLKKQVLEQHFVECRKSAITSWQPLPTSHGAETWMVEMFTNADKNFALIKVVQQVDASQEVLQSYTVSFQQVDIPNKSNINEFCGPG